jgi:hypothetical protein
MERLKKVASNFFLINLEIPIEESWSRSEKKFNNSRKEFNEYVAKFVPFDKNFVIKSITLDGTENSVTNVAKVVEFLRYNVRDE